MRTFGKIILRIFDGIAKILAFLLVSCGLWLPALFCTAFFIGCAATGTRFVGGISALFWCGLGFTAMLGMGLAVFFRSKRKQKVSENAATQSAPVAEKARKRDRKRNKKEENVATQAQPAQPVPPPYPYGGYDPYRNTYANPYTQGGYPPPAYPYPPQGQSYAPDNAGAPPVYANAAPPRAENDRRDLDRKYFGGDAPPAANAQPDPTPARYERTASYDHDVTPLSYGKTMTKTQEIAADDRLGADELWRRLSGADVPDEQPLVFRTRRDPELFVYEYSDRLQYWRRTKAGMVLEQTEFKTQTSKRV